MENIECIISSDESLAFTLPHTHIAHTDTHVAHTHTHTLHKITNFKFLKSIKIKNYENDGNTYIVFLFMAYLHESIDS